MLPYSETQVANEVFDWLVEQPAPACLAGPTLAAAVTANRILARRHGWGCVVGGAVRPTTRVRTLLGLAAGATEEAVAQSACNYQTTQLGQRSGDGQIGSRTWAGMRQRGALPAFNFRAASWEVYHGRRKLGVIEKTGPYRRLQDATRGRASVQFAFRVTDMAAVTRAGFVNAAGEDNFRWVQVIETNRQLAPAPVILIRRYGRYIDPNTGSGAIDNHPYYWDNAGTGTARFRITRFVNREAANGLCYDLIFEDVPSRPLSEASPGRRVYWNAETALVGVRTGNRNVVLNTVRWGFDLVSTGGTVGVRLNALRAGPRGGSTAFRRVLSQAIAAGQFPGHCFVGSGFTGTARCV